MASATVFYMDEAVSSKDMEKKKKQLEKVLDDDILNLFNHGILQGMFIRCYRDDRKDTIIVKKDGVPVMDISPKHIRHVKSIRSDMIQEFAKKNNRTVELVDSIDTVGEIVGASRTNWWVKKKEVNKRNAGTNTRIDYAQIIGGFHGSNPLDVYSDMTARRINELRAQLRP